MPHDDCRKRTGLPLHGEIVTFVGDLSRWQGVDVLMRSIPMVLNGLPEALFVIVGGGAALVELRHQARDLGVENSVVFTGPVDYEEVPYYVGASDVAVAPRRKLASSSSPLKLYEYLACGRPVVASNIPEFRILEDHQLGLVLDPEDSGALADAILRLLRDPQACQEMGARGRTIVEKEYSWRAVAARIASFF